MMALTATAQSVLPTWDETIVPALRKRLESESRILAKRMSIASISSIDDAQRSSHSRRSSRDVPQAPRHLPEPRKSSAIPRPSLQYPKTANDSRSDASSSNTRVNGASSSSAYVPKRARTYSQPPSPTGFTNNPLPTPESSRPTSPRTSDVKPTRIPIAARARTMSGSSHAHIIAQRAESRNGSNHRPYQPPTPDISQDHWVVRPSDPPQPSTPPIASIRHQASNIMNEPPPFTTPSITSSIRSRMQEPVHIDSRPSTDSEERPFEHWYRGDVHRNGGVGELRVARHIEMLQIANYGHSLRKAVRGQARNFSDQTGSIRSRKRADSVDTGTRESLYLDDERTKDVHMVLDETPLTDIEADPDTDPESFYDAYASADAEPDADDTIHSAFAAAALSHPLAAVSSSRSQTPTNAILDDTTTKYATYPQTAGDRSVTPSAPLRTSAESTVPAPSATGSRPRAGSRATSPTSQSSDQSYTKRRAKSPAAPSPASTPKKPRINPKSPPPTSRRDDPRFSIATYPTPEGDVVDAIPTWTQPVLKSGNWDEVVLPVVARKKGLDGQYEQADGSPKPPEPSPIKPAPGTFGYDYTKYRPPRREEEIQMHEFGRLPEPCPISEEEPVPPPPEPSPPPISLPLPPDKPEEPIQPDPRQTVPKPPNSPPPFSHYRIDHQVPTINITRPSLDTVGRRQVQEDEDASGGCCRCVIM